MGYDESKIKIFFASGFATRRGAPEISNSGTIAQFLLPSKEIPNLLTHRSDFQDGGSPWPRSPSLTANRELGARPRPLHSREKTYFPCWKRIWRRVTVTDSMIKCREGDFG
jgi:hypothetical protein